MTDIKTASGYLVTIREELNYGQFLELQKTYASLAKIDIDTQKITEINPVGAIDSQSKAIELVVVKIIDPSGKELTDLVQAVTEMPIQDGKQISEACNKIANEASIPKKN